MRLGLLTAAEASGDRIAAALHSELRARHPEHSWRGMAGPLLRGNSEFEAIGRVEDLSGAGLVELIPRLPQLWRGRRRLQKELDAEPNLAIFVDAPDLHLPLASRARRRNVPAVQLVVPQFWAWRPRRKEVLARNTRLCLCLFPFEVAPLRALGAAAHWVGHPLVDELTDIAPVRPDRAKLRVALLPGSRPSEVKANLPRLQERLENALGQTPREVVVPWRLQSPSPEVPGITFSKASGAEVLASSDLAVVAFGTASLEAALLGIPQIAFGSAHPLTRLVVSPLLRTPWLALPNILLQRAAVAEYLLPDSETHFDLQLRATLEDLASSQEESRALAAELREVLGAPGFAARAADCLEPLL